MHQEIDEERTKADRGMQPSPCRYPFGSEVHLMGGTLRVDRSRTSCARFVNRVPIGADTDAYRP